MHQVKCQNFLAISDEYRLGNLITESVHPLTTYLSDLAQTDLPKACQTLKEVDIEALKCLKNQAMATCDLFDLLKSSMLQTIAEGGKIFLVGCGSTGRLSLLLETLWRDQFLGSEHFDKVVSFMAGGDLALIKSVEKFEDFPNYGATQLEDLNFSEKDLLIASTEGGETPFVMGAVIYASQVAKRKPFYLFCNPQDLLCQEILRTHQVLLNDKIIKINLTVGPMALSGSTRMQASSAIMFYLGYALLGFQDSKQNIEAFCQEIEKLLLFLQTSDLAFLASFIELEEQILRAGDLIIYEGCIETGMSIVSDTTERAPTFGIDPFDNLLDANPIPSWCYFQLKGSNDSLDAWQKLLRRSPRTVEWLALNGVASQKRLLGFDFSVHTLQKRQKLYPTKKQHIFEITRQNHFIHLQFGSHTKSIDSKFMPLTNAVLLKMLLNIHSTCLMGRMGRYQGNIMTWVRPSNYKLIDRSVRYCDLLLKRKGIEQNYDDICLALFRLKDDLMSHESIVLKVVDYFLNPSD